MRLAIAARIWESGRSSYSTPGRTGAVTGAAAPGAAATGAAATVTVAASTSRRMMRPPGPVPRISRRSTPVCAAIFFARGDALTRPVATAVGAVRAGAGMPTAPALTAAGRETDGTVAGAAGAGADGAGAGAAGGAERVSFRAEAPPVAPAPAATAGASADTSTAATS